MHSNIAQLQFASKIHLKHIYNSSIILLTPAPDYFTDFGKGEAAGSFLRGKIADSLAYSRIRQILTETQKVNQHQQSLENQYVQLIETLPSTPYSDQAAASFTLENLSMRYNVAITMRLDRLFSTIQEDRVSLSEPAAIMLQNEEFINFFMTCGPNYVRSLHRAQEVTAVFTFETDDDFKAQAFVNKLKLYVYGNRGKTINAKVRKGQMPSSTDIQSLGFDMEDDFDDADIKDSLSIELLAYGLGLNKTNGSTNSLISTSLDEFNHVMKFSFDSMTKSNQYRAQTGFIHGVEIVPWSDNAQFLQITNAEQERILAAVPRGLVDTATTAMNSQGQQETVCLSPLHVLDDFGKCCDEVDIIKVAADEDNRVEGMKSCDPLNPLASVTMKDNLQINAEFISWMSSVARDKVKSLANLGQCVSALKSFPKRNEYFYVQSNDKVEFDESVDMKFTVRELKAALDPYSDLSILSMVGSENDEYFEMFYRPCLAALYGRNSNRGDGIDPKFLMVEPWYNHKECAMPSCLEPNKAWNRQDGDGCVDGLLRRNNHKTQIPVDGDPFCATSIDMTSGEETCKYKFHPLVIRGIDNCREKLPQAKDARGRPRGLSMADLIDYFCMPTLSTEEANAAKMDMADYGWDQCVSIV